MNTLILIMALAQSPAAMPTPAPQFVYIQEPEAHPRLLHAAIAAHVIAQFADVSTTSYAMGRGGFREANPVMRPFAGNPIRLAIVKGVYAAATTHALVRLHKTRPKTAFALAAGSAVLTSYVAARNARVVRK